MPRGTGKCCRWEMNVLSEILSWFCCQNNLTSDKRIMDRWMDGWRFFPFGSSAFKWIALWLIKIFDSSLCGKNNNTNPFCSSFQWDIRHLSIMYWKRTPQSPVHFSLATCHPISTGRRQNIHASWIYCLFGLTDLNAMLYDWTSRNTKAEEQHWTRFVWSRNIVLDNKKTVKVSLFLRSI